MTFNHSLRRMADLRPLPLAPEGSWWAQDPEHFYATAAQEAPRMTHSKIAHEIKAEGEAKTSGAG